MKYDKRSKSECQDDSGTTSVSVLESNEPLHVEAVASCKLATSTTNNALSDRVTRPMDYWSVFVNYPMFRYYFLSHLCLHIGNWFVRIASLLVVEQLSGKSTGSSVGDLIICTMIPKAVFAQIGGVVADSFDRRKVMIVIDCIAGFTVLGNLAAVQQKSLGLLFFFSALRSGLESMYYPAMTGMVPLVVPEARDLQLAVTINSWAWCFMAILGGAVAGVATAMIGYQACFVVDSATYFISAFLVFHGISGNFNVRDNDERQPSDGSVSPLVHTARSFKELAVYLSTCGFGLLVFLKASAAGAWAPENLVSVAYTNVIDDKEKSSILLGATFTVIGLGSWMGPTVLNIFSDAKMPATLQRACVIGLIVMSIGWLCIALSSDFGWHFLLATFVRHFGSSSVWIISTLTLQTLTEKKILGRVLALDFTLFSLLEALSAAGYGRLYDSGLSKQSISLIAFTETAVLVIFWGIYHTLQKGAADPKFNRKYSLANTCDPDTEAMTSLDSDDVDSKLGS